MMLIALVFIVAALAVIAAGTLKIGIAIIQEIADGWKL
jgi:hypothetical protein